MILIIQFATNIGYPSICQINVLLMVVLLIMTANDNNPTLLPLWIAFVNRADWDGPKDYIVLFTFTVLQRTIILV